MTAEHGCVSVCVCDHALHYSDGQLVHGELEDRVAELAEELVRERVLEQRLQGDGVAKDLFLLAAPGAAQVGPKDVVRKALAGKGLDDEGKKTHRGAEGVGWDGVYG